MSEEIGTLKFGEIHPAAYIARDYIREQTILDFESIMMLKESLASCALSGDRASEIASETWRRLDAGEPVSDRYLMGLAWIIQQILERKQSSTHVKENDKQPSNPSEDE